MASSSATVPTPRAGIYMKQLCKHFGHKVPVELTETEGRIELPFGICRMVADDAALAMTVEGDSAEIGRLEKVIGDHLCRFAFRENPAITWHRTA